MHRHANWPPSFNPLTPTWANHESVWLGYSGFIHFHQNNKLPQVQKKPSLSHVREWECGHHLRNANFLIFFFFLLRRRRAPSTDTFLRFVLLLCFAKFDDADELMGLHLFPFSCVFVCVSGCVTFVSSFLINTPLSIRRGRLLVDGLRKPGPPPWQIELCVCMFEMCGSFESSSWVDWANDILDGWLGNKKTKDDDDGEGETLDSLSWATKEAKLQRKKKEARGLTQRKERERESLVTQLASLMCVLLLRLCIGMNILKEGISNLQLQCITMLLLLLLLPWSQWMEESRRLLEHGISQSHMTPRKTGEREP